MDNDSSSRSGLPNTVPDLAAVNAQREFQSHGPHGSQGGEAGNEQQTYWAVLAASNAVFAAEQTGQAIIKEMILEGPHEPFDDVEIIKADGSYTLFQSKHRDTKGSSNNITFTQLFERPGKGEEAQKSAPFSLLKYFKGMMSPAQVNVALQRRYILAVTANLGNNFYTPKEEGKRHISLPAHTWTSTGVLRDLTDAEKDSLLTTVYSRAGNKPLSEFLSPVEKPQYMAFSQAFIDNTLQDPSFVLFRNYIFSKFNAFLNDERGKAETWVSWPQADDDVKIKLFLTQMQLWLNQPKVNRLKEIIQQALKLNFNMGFTDIEHCFYAAIKNSANKHEKSLVINDIVAFLKRARGGVLSRYLGVLSNEYQQHHLLDAAAPGMMSFNEITAFLNGSRKLLLLGTDNLPGLKYAAYSWVSTHVKNNEKFALIDYDSKPIFHEDKETKEILESQMSDVFYNDELNYIIIDNAHKLLGDLLKRNILKNLLKSLVEHNTKLLLLYPGGEFESIWMLLCEINFTRDLFDAYAVDQLNLNLNDAFVNQKLVGNEDSEKQLTLVSGASLYLKQASSHHPSLFYAAKSANILADILALSITQRPTDEQIDIKNALYQALPIQHFEAFYSLDKIIDSKKYAQIHISCSNVVEVAQNLSRYSQYKLENLYNCVRLILDKEGVILKAKVKADDVNFVSISDPLNHGFKADLFGEAANEQGQATLLLRSLMARRILMEAEYGAGKTALKENLYHQWKKSLTEQDAQNRYDWVIPMHLSKIGHHLQHGKNNLIDVVEAVLKEDAQINEDFPLWKREFFKQALAQGRVLLILDSWDEAHVYWDSLNEWFAALPLEVSVVITSRIKMTTRLKIQLDAKVTLGPLKSEQINKFISTYFENLKSKLPKETTADKKHAEFIKKIFSWINLANKENLEILQRPLHVNLLCDAMQRYYDDFMTQEQAKMPWEETVLYRTQLYQLVVSEQLRRYCVHHLQINPLAIKPALLSIHTQVIQVRAREIAFEKIFPLPAYRILSYLDLDTVDEELSHIGLFTTNKATGTHEAHRIFIEYFAALYLLAGLLRLEKNDLYYQGVCEIINTQRFNPAYEQVWRILGEMIRYGEPSLNFKGIGADANIYAHYKEWFPKIDLSVGMDVIFFEQLQGQSSIPAQTLSKDKYESFFISIENENHTAPEANLAQPHEFLLQAVLDNSKDRAQALINATKINYNEAAVAQIYLENSQACISDSDQLKRIKAILDKGKWRDKGSGYWDIDVFLPLINKLHPLELDEVITAYLVYRVPCPYGFYDNIDFPFKRMIHDFLSCDLLRLSVRTQINFLIMHHTLLHKKAWFTTGFSAYSLPKIINLAWHVFMNHQDVYWIGIDALYQIAQAFSLPIVLYNDNVIPLGIEIQIPFLKDAAAIRFPANPIQLKQLEQRFLDLSKQFDPPMAYEKPDCLARLDNPVGARMHAAYTNEHVVPENIAVFGQEKLIFQ